MRMPWTKRRDKVDAAVHSFAAVREAARLSQTAASRRLILVAMGRAAGEDEEVDDELEQVPHQ